MEAGTGGRTKGGRWFRGRRAVIYLYIRAAHDKRAMTRPYNFSPLPFLGCIPSSSRSSSLFLRRSRLRPAPRHPFHVVPFASILLSHSRTLPTTTHSHHTASLPPQFTYPRHPRFDNTPSPAITFPSKRTFCTLQTQPRFSPASDRKICAPERARACHAPPPNLN